MNFKYDNVFLNETSLVAGPYEAKGPFKNYFDKTYNEFYFNMNSWEEAESSLIDEAVDILLSKANLSSENIDIHISSDLLNQLVSSNYAAAKLSIPFIGIYAACASSTLGLIIASNMIDKKEASTAICTVSSHNAAAEKQFRYPVEYGGPKRKTTTVTSTGGCAALVSRKKKGVRIDSGTIGSVVDMGISDVYHMGAVMAPAAAETLVTHLKYNKRDSKYYDIILTGDLGIYGKSIFLSYLKEKYGITLNNYEDAASILYKGNKNMYAGGSGPSCLPLLAYGYIFDAMKNKKYKKVLLIATGALHNVTMCNLKKSIPGIAHAISLEVI